MRSQFEVFLDFAHVAQNVGNLVLEADDVSLCKHHFDVFLIQFLEGADDAVQRPYFVIYWLFESLQKGFSLGLQLLHLSFERCNLGFTFTAHCQNGQVLSTHLLQFCSS